MADTIKLEVSRYSPETDAAPHFQSFEVPFRRDWVVLDALNYIKDKQDGSLTYRWSCAWASAAVAACWSMASRN